MSSFSTPVIEYFISVLQNAINKYKKTNENWERDSDDFQHNEEIENEDETDPTIYNALFQLKLHYKTNLIPQEHIDLFNELAPFITECEFESWFMNEHEIYKDESEFTHENFMKEYPFMKDRDSYGGNDTYDICSLQCNTFKHIMKIVLLQQLNN